MHNNYRNDRKQISHCLVMGKGVGRDYKGNKEIWGVSDLFTILIVMIVSQFYMYIHVKTY